VRREAKKIVEKRGSENQRYEKEKKKISHTIIRE